MKWFLLILALSAVMISGCFIQKETQVKFSVMKLIKVDSSQTHSKRMLTWKEIETGLLFYSYDNCDSYGEEGQLHKVGDVAHVFVKR